MRSSSKKRQTAVVSKSHPHHEKKSRDVLSITQTPDGYEVQMTQVFSDKYKAFHLAYQILKELST